MGFIDTPDGARLGYDVSGQGPAVVFIHPGLWDRRVWDAQMSSFPGAGYRAVRYDVRGYGESSRPEGASYSHVRDLVAVFDALEIQQAAIVGCSMGGGIGLDFALEHPDRVWALVPVASGLGGFEPLEEEEDHWEEVSRPVGQLVEAGDIERAQELRLSLLWAPLGTDDEAGARIRAIAFDNLHELTMDESGVEELDPPAATRLSEIDLPTLVLIAEHDPPFMRRCNELIARGIPDARKVTIEGADHVVNLRQPARFERAVLPFLNEVRLGV
jgi:pimeloyl-ACP methyl ester carboxylesterase